jgi:hypothetical protein
LTICKQTLLSIIIVIVVVIDVVVVVVVTVLVIAVVIDVVVKIRNERTSNSKLNTVGIEKCTNTKYTNGKGKTGLDKI